VLLSSEPGCVAVITSVMATEAAAKEAASSFADTDAASADREAASAVMDAAPAAVMLPCCWAWACAGPISGTGCSSRASTDFLLALLLAGAAPAVAAGFAALSPAVLLAGSLVGAAGVDREAAGDCAEVVLVTRTGILWVRSMLILIVL
jgi:hypothetical protein